MQGLPKATKGKYMIQISRNGLQYRLMMYGTFQDPNTCHVTNLCPFVRRMILGVFLALIVYPIVGALLLHAFLTPFIQGVTSLYYWDSSYFLVKTPWLVLGIAMYFTIIAAIAIGALRTYLDNRQYKMYEENFQATLRGELPKETGTLKPFIKAIKDKVCPSIEIVD